MVDDFMEVLADLRDKFIRPADLIARSMLGPLQFYALTLLSREDSLSMSELAREMLVSKQQLSPLVNKLIENNLLLRKVDENDRRKVRIAITRPGRDLYYAVRGEVTSAITEKLKALPAGELEDLEQVLKKGQDILKKIT